MVKQQGSPGRRANAPSTKPAVASSDAVPADVPVIDEPREPLGVESTVVSRETATHLAFAKSRKEDFVYAETEHYMHILNNFCQWDRDTIQSPSVLVVVGRAGTGKSSLLANWSEQRRHYKTKANGSAGLSIAEELVYEHFAGCSYDSVKLSLFLFRFMNQVKISFGLRDFELPPEHEEEKLKFSLARCLEAAVGKSSDRAVGSTSQSKRIILVLDGIDSVRTEDGGDSLSWLPNTLPPGVRIIVSATLATTDKTARLQCCRSILRKPVIIDDDGELVYDLTLKPRKHDSRTIRELRRRNALFLEIEPLDEATSTNIIELYERKHNRTFQPEDKQMLVSACGSANPLYMRLVLTTLDQSYECGEEDTQDGKRRHRWFQRMTGMSDLHGVFGLVLKRWNEILLADLYEQLHQCQTGLEASAYSTGVVAPSQMRGLRRTPSKSTGGEDPETIAAAESDDTTDEALLLKSGSIVKTGSAKAIPVGPGRGLGMFEPTDVESIQTAIEQRALLVRHTLSLLAVTRYGLSETDLINLIGSSIDSTVFEQMFMLLRPHLMEIRRPDCGPNTNSSNIGGNTVVLYDLSHNQLRRITRYGFLHDQQLRGAYYRGLATYFGNMDACQRRIDELPVQLERCAMWSTLQSSLVNIKMFQLWWNRRNRQEFFSHWLALSGNSSTHDPVDDFIRSLDDFIVHENPSADQLLALFMTITAFLRAWQKVNSGGRSSASTNGGTASALLNRPKPPQLQEFITSLGSFTTSHLPEREARRVQHEIEALCTHSDDGYNVQRWLWTQFPLIGIAFECRVVRGVSSSSSNKATTSNSNNASEPATQSNDDGVSNSDGKKKKASYEDDADRVTLSVPKVGLAPSVSSPMIGKVAKHAHFSDNSSPGCESPSTSKKQMLGKRRQPQPTIQRSLSTSLDSPSGFDADDVLGTFEFLSPESGDGSLASVSKLESQLVELRTKHDKLKFAVREKSELLRTLESRVLDARTQAQAAGQSATQMDSLHEHLRRVGDETAVGRQRGDYYRAILRHCEVNPARDPNTIEAAEAVVHKLRHEIVELQQRTQVITYETRLASGELPKLRQATKDKAAIHETALARLRWRRELNLRMVARSGASGSSKLKTGGNTRGTAQVGGAGRQASDEETDDDDEDVPAESGGNSAGETSQVQIAATDVNFVRAKDKLLHMKETSIARQRNAASLQMYFGSAYKDDGFLGALRRVGINRPEDVQVYWQSQLDHAGQLEDETKQAETRVAELRDRLQSLQTQFVSLKLGGIASACDDEPQGSSASAIATSPMSVTPGASASGTPSTGTAGAGGSSNGDGGNGAAPRLKELEQQLAETTAVNQQKRERVMWMRALHEKLQLGLHHIAQVLGVPRSSTLDLLGLVDAIDHGVRHVLGEETHLQSAASVNLRRKNSVRMAANPLSGGASATYLPLPARSDDEKMRYNIRISLAQQQRQMNPYVVDEDMGDDSGRADDDDEIDGLDSDEYGDMNISMNKAAGSRDDGEEAVKKRSDIKNSSRREVEKKAALQKSKTKKKSSE